MPPRIDQLTQRELILQLRLLLDPTCEDLACGHRGCTKRRISVAFVLIRNPHNVWSTKVLHNIGKGRLRKLLRMTNPPSAAARARTRARGFPIRCEPRRRKIVAPRGVSSDPHGARDTLAVTEERHD